MNTAPESASGQPQRSPSGAEAERLQEDAMRKKNWKRWGPYLAERQWGTVREDYSATGECWDYFPHDHARSRAYRWGEDGLLGFTDRECRLCFAVALWNGRDPILKERLFGLNNSEGNHGEDVKEEYFYLDSTPTHSYAKALYKYPQAEFPYARLVEENRHRGRGEPEFELVDTGVFDESRRASSCRRSASAPPGARCGWPLGDSGAVFIQQMILRAISPPIPHANSVSARERQQPSPSPRNLWGQCA